MAGLGLTNRALLGQKGRHVSYRLVFHTGLGLCDKRLRNICFRHRLVALEIQTLRVTCRPQATIKAKNVRPAIHAPV